MKEVRVSVHMEGIDDVVLWVCMGVVLVKFVLWWLRMCFFGLEDD